ncbi:methionine/alanine import family NSS transporter small subunit [Mesobacillus maritimus]|nr:methionine/alanine import family NSS transporter small subunit [Mesobacillus maritimus]MCM3670262.1 methionine/alanine import family NSS transporter small subunit [Mesobacillus maritimus]
MEASAIVMMIAGMVIIWGGLAASVTHAVKKSRQRSES